MLNVLFNTAKTHLMISLLVQETSVSEQQKLLLLMYYFYWPNVTLCIVQFVTKCSQSG